MIFLTPEQAKAKLQEEQKRFFIGQEKEFEEYVLKNLDDICRGLSLPPALRVIQQLRKDLPTFLIRPDVFVVHADMTTSVFEIKCSNAKYPSTGVSEQCKSIGQLLLYKSVLTELNGASPRIFLVDQKIYFRTVCVFSEMQLPITLIEIQDDVVFVPYMHHTV